MTKELTFISSGNYSYSEEITAGKNGQIALQFVEEKSAYQVDILTSVNGKDYVPIGGRRIETSHAMMVSVMAGMKIKVRSETKHKVYVFTS